MKVAKFLKRVRNLMAPETWTKDTLARYRDGTVCTATDESACMFCLHGYIWRAYFVTSPVELGHFVPNEDFLEVIRVSNPQIPNGNITRYNDDPATTFKDIVAVIDNAIQEAERRDL